MKQTRYEELVIPGVKTITPFKPPMEKANSSKTIKLDSNESLLGASSKAITAIVECASKSHLYPETSGTALKQALALNTGLDTSWITLGNGSNDVLDIIARTFCHSGDEIVFSQYAFAVYPLITKLVGANAIQVPAKAGYGHDLVAMAKAVTTKTKVIFIANPNNPTGTWCSRLELSAFLEAVPQHVIVVLDEAYIEYCSGGDFPNGLEYIRRYPNLILTRTFSKAWGLAALRIGYALAIPEITDYLNRVRQPFNVNKLAMVAAEAALSDKEHLLNTVRLTSEGMRDIVAKLEENGIGYIPSRGNFICIDVGDAMGTALALREKGILITPLANYGLSNYIRLTIGTAEQNNKTLNMIFKLIETVVC